MERMIENSGCEFTGDATVLNDVLHQEGLLSTGEITATSPLEIQAAIKTQIAEPQALSHYQERSSSLEGTPSHQIQPESVPMETPPNSQPEKPVIPQDTSAIGWLEPPSATKPPKISFEGV